MDEEYRILEDAIEVAGNLAELRDERRAACPTLEIAAILSF